MAVFCGSSPGARPAYAEAAQQLGATIAAMGATVVYGGASVGLMGAVADGALGAGGQVYGVLTSALASRELEHPGLTELDVVATMHERKAKMADRADAFVLAPGGIGSLDEFMEVLTWFQLGIHDKPCGVLNTSGYFDPLLDFVDHAVAERFVADELRRSVVVGEDPGALLEAMAAVPSLVGHKWLHEHDR